MFDEDLNGHLNDKNTIPDRRHDSLSYTRPPMAEIATQTAFGTNLTYIADIKKPPKFGRFWPFSEAM